jgi:DUF971 family protein
MGGDRVLVKPVPEDIKAIGEEVAIKWNDQHQSRYGARDLRLACRCAACVDEWTHQSLVKPDLVPLHVKPKNIEVMGNYALHFEWSDGHNTGIYTYDFLREVCACDECKSKRSFAV